jgi:hypothetical protein
MSRHRCSGLHVRFERLVGNFHIEFAGGKIALAWSFEMPLNLHSDASRQIYLSVVRKDRVVLLNGAVTSQTSGDAVERLLEDCLATLRVSEKPIDVKKLQVKIRKDGKL